MNRAGSPQTPHFRTACDPCSTAKVRCDKKHPSCGRCVRSGAPCSYGKSRKHGKQPWRKRRTYEQAKTQAESSAPDQNQLAHAESPNLATWTINPLLPSATVTWIEDQTMDPLLQNGQFQFDSSFHAEIGATSTARWDTTGLSPYLLPIENSAVPVFESGHQDAAQKNTIETQTETSTTLSAPNLHDCEAKAVSLLRSLQHGQIHQGVTSCSTMQYESLNLTPGFDRVLSANKAALRGWSKLMACACAKCPHLILLYVSVLSKMLFWYRLAAKERVLSPETDDDDASNSACGLSRGSSLSLDEAPSLDRFDIQTTTIQVGMHSLDPEDQASMRRVLLIGELRKMEKAIDELMRANRAPPDKDADEALQRAVQWSLSGVILVREELQLIVKRVEGLL